MLMPYLAGYLAGPLGLAAWAVGLVLGVRNFSQQGMFIVGGTLADRLGYKPLIVAGCLLRTAGFGLLVFAHSLPAVLIASAATGFAGALFNPAVRAYLAADAGQRRVEAFAGQGRDRRAGLLPEALQLRIVVNHIRHQDLTGLEAGDFGREAGAVRLAQHFLYANTSQALTRQQVLAAIAEAAPQSLADLQGISGIGTKKLDAYGEQVLRVCKV